MKREPRKPRKPEKNRQPKQLDLPFGPGKKPARRKAGAKIEQLSTVRDVREPKPLEQPKPKPEPKIITEVELAKIGAVKAFQDELARTRFSGHLKLFLENTLKRTGRKLIANVHLGSKKNIRHYSMAVKEPGRIEFLRISLEQAKVSLEESMTLYRIGPSLSINSRSITVKEATQLINKSKQALKNMGSKYILTTILKEEAFEYSAQGYRIRQDYKSAAAGEEVWYASKQL